MADVTGSLGNEPIELNNAATEATLKLLLVAMKASSKEAAAAVDKIAKEAGIDPATVKKANEANEKSAGVAYKVGSVFGSLANTAERVIDIFNDYSPVVKTLTSGGTNVGQAMSQLGALIPGVAGKVVTALGEVAAIQTEYLGAYQKMTQAGVGFGGSLTDMRMAASQSYQTLEQFTQMVSTHGEALARMGGTAGDGAKSFAHLSHELISSPVGDKLQALGMTTDEINNKTLEYISRTGGRTRQEMANTELLTKATGDYFSELDRLTQFTGVSRKKMEEEQNKAAQNAAFQRKLAGMSEAERAKTQAAYDKAAASGIKGATDLVMSTALGLPPMTDAAKALSGVAPEAAQGIADMTKTAMTAGTTQQQVTDKFGNVLTAAADKAKQMGTTADAVSQMQGEQGAVIGTLLGVENTMRSKGIKTQEDFNKAFGETAEEQKKREASQAADAAASAKALQEMGQNLMQVLMPAFRILAWTVNFVVGAISIPFKLLGSIIDKTVELFKPLMPSLIKFGDAFGSVLTPVMDVLKAMGSALLDVIDLSLTPFKIMFSVLLKTLEVGIDVVSWSLGYLGKFLKMLSEVVVSVWTGISDVAKAIKSFLPSWAGGDSKKPEGKAVGGPVSANKQYLVGEKGPELFTPGSSGQIVPNGSMMDKILPAIKDMAKLTPIGMAANAVGSLMGDNSSSQSGSSMSDKHLENLSLEMKMLNTRVLELLKHSRDTADYARQNVDATKDLNGNLFS